MKKPKKLIKFSHEDKIYTAKKTIGRKGKEVYRLFKPRGCQPWTSTNSSFDMNQPSPSKKISNSNTSEDSESEDSFEETEIQVHT